MPHYLITITRRNGLRYKDAYFGMFSPGQGEYLEPCEGPDATYAKGQEPPNYLMPAIPIKIEYVFEPYNWTGNGIFVCERGAIVAGAYQDGMPID